MGSLQDEQLRLPLDRRHTPEEIRRAVERGGARIEGVVLTRNRRIMASLAERGRTLRLHEAFVMAPRQTLEALGRLLSSRSRAARSRARLVVREFLEAERPRAVATTPAPRRIRPSDLPHIERLEAEFEAVNAEHFQLELRSVPIRISGRMRRRLGHFCSDPLEIVISRTLCERAPTAEALGTLRHEMIHLWQWQNGLRPGHDADFRRWARSLGIPPRASRHVCWTPASPFASPPTGQ